MSKSRKILSVLLALAMVFSVLTVSASAAANYEDEGVEYAQEWELVEVSNDGATCVVNVVLTTNYPTGSIQFVIENSNPAAAVLDYENVALGSGITFDAEIKANANGKVLIIPETVADTVTAPVLDGAVVATLTYNCTGSATLKIKNDPKTAANPSGTLIAARMTDSDIVTGDPIVGQAATVTGTVNIGGAAAPAELVVKDGTNGVIDDTRMCVYGIDIMDAGQSIGDVFEVTNGGSIEVTPSNEGVEEGTGAILVAKDATGEVIGEYVVVIHGDVNGDGASDSLDADILCQFEGGLVDVLFDITTLPQELLALA